MKASCKPLNFAWSLRAMATPERSGLRRASKGSDQERDPRARAIDEAIDGQPGKCDRVRTPGSFRAISVISRITFSVRSNWRRLATAQSRRDSLVLHRHEARRNFLEHKPGPSDQGKHRRRGRVAFRPTIPRTPCRSRSSCARNAVEAAGRTGRKPLHRRVRPSFFCRSP